MRAPESLDTVDDAVCWLCFCFFNVRCLVSSALKSLTPFEFTALFVAIALFDDAECDGDSLGGDVRLGIAETKH